MKTYIGGKKILQDIILCIGEVCGRNLECKSGCCFNCAKFNECLKNSLIYNENIECSINSNLFFCIQILKYYQRSLGKL